MALEILSPAGSYEALTAAIRAGADAVYFGAGDFNARRNAKNFTDEELTQAFRDCRLRGVKTYVTVNTLVTDRELPRLKPLLARLSALGADALIVQDLGVLRMVRALAPDLPLHGSTQMSVHSLEGVLAAQKLGLSRVVLARELPLAEIRHICAQSPIEIEIFCHGALCMSYSGQCYLSSVIGGRSGNRGLCAQPCRLPYAFFGEGMRHPLSLKDLTYAQYLRDIEEAGVACVKIEGRMKRPEYVALVTRAFKNAAMSGEAPSNAEMSKLRAVFSRDGFTDGYLTDRKGNDMFGVRSEADAREARTVLREGRDLYEGEGERPTVGVDFRFTARRGEPITLSADDGCGNEFTATALPPEEAHTRATNHDDIESGLLKTGGTVFFPRSIHVELEDGLRIASGAVNALRRRALEGVEARRVQPPARREGHWEPGLRRLAPAEPPRYIFAFRKMEQVTPALLEREPAFVYLPVAEAHRHLELTRMLAAHGVRIAAVLPRIVFERERAALLDQLAALYDAGVRDAVCGNIGHAVLLRGTGFALRGDFGLNVMNSQTLKELKTLGFESATLSFELTLPQIRDLSSNMPTELLAYGRLPLMLTENCVIKTRTGQCACGGAPAQLTDRTGRSFTVLPEPGHRNTVYNAEKLWLADKLSDLKGLGLSYLRLSFTTENARECEQVAACYLDGKGQPPERVTRGLYYRGVE